MKMAMSYSTLNTVVEFVDNRSIAWQTGPTGGLGQGAGRTDLALRARDRSTEGTRVRESWDITTDHQRVLSSSGTSTRNKTRRDMERTLARLERSGDHPTEADPAEPHRFSVRSGRWWRCPRRPE